MPGTELPTKEQIEALPRWARVAFAARCARRVLPVVGTDFPKQITAAVEYAESAARSPGKPSETECAAMAAELHSTLKALTAVVMPAMNAMSHTLSHARERIRVAKAALSNQPNPEVVKQLKAESDFMDQVLEASRTTHKSASEVCAAAAATCAVECAAGGAGSSTAAAATMVTALAAVGPTKLSTESFATDRTPAGILQI